MKNTALLSLVFASSALGLGCMSAPDDATSDDSASDDSPVVTEQAFPERHGDVQHTIIQTPQGARLQGYEVIDDQMVTEGDILLGEARPDHDSDHDSDHLDLDSLTRSAGRLNRSYTWPNGRVPFEIDPAIGAAQRADILSALEHWNLATLYKFSQRVAEADYVRFVPSTGCSSWVGRQGGRQTINLAAGCGRGSTIHEIGHAVGLWHEQSRANRNAFVTINYANVQAGMAFNFDTYVQQGADGQDMFDYDFSSIMHYDALAFSRNGLPTITRRDGQPLVAQRNGLSETDVAGATRLLNGGPVPLYSLRNVRTGKCMDVGDGSRRSQASVNQFTCNTGGNQRWYFLLVPGTSRYVVVNGHSGHCLDIPWGSTNGGEGLQQFSCNGASAQQFDRVNVSGGMALRRAGTNLCLEASPAGVNSTQLRQVTCTYATQQLWTVVP